MNTHKLLRAVSISATALVVTGSALAAPVLKSEVVVTAEVVTVSDMFEDAGAWSKEALFRAPAPGTSGNVSLEAVRSAAARVGLVDFDAADVDTIRVARKGSVVDEAMLNQLISDDLRARGIIADDAEAQALFDQPPGQIAAAAADKPAELLNLRYLPGNGTFSARFIIAGRKDPLDLTGRVDLTVEVAHLASNLAAGTVLSANDIIMRPVPLEYAAGSGGMPLEQLVGKALQHQSRAGLMLKPTDIAEPQLIARNEPVTVYYRRGAMTLSVKGQALNAASLGQPVAVLNQLSKKVIHGVALSQGAVEIKSGDLTVAGL